MTPPRLALHALAREAGVLTAYRDSRGMLRVATPDALLAVLRALGIDIDRADQAADTLRALRARPPALEPCSVAWDGSLTTPLRLPVSAPGPVRLTLVDEAGVESPLEARRFDAGGATRLRPCAPLPFGLLTMRVETGGHTWETFVISAPGTAQPPPAARSWGAFLPLHAFGTSAVEAMSYRDLDWAARTLGGLGARFVGTLPMLASFLDRPFDPSPYAPASRLFWNDLFVDLEDAHGAGAGGNGRLFEYAAAATARRPRLQAAADAFFADDARDPAFDAWLATQPHAEAYARFRAATEHFGTGYTSWPAGAGEDLAALPLDPAVERRHLWAAWRAEQQVAALGRAAREEAAAALYLDLPLGVHGEGFDTWRWPELFATGMSVGAPPDALFRGGQDWGFRPLVPSALRRTGYRYLAEVLRHHMRHAGALRIDHVMSLVRLFWIPAGFPATEGVYVRYRRDELLALLVLESRRHETLLIGEDLGTVPEEVRSAMRARALLRMFVLQFAAPGPAGVPLAPAGTVASLDTHDTPTFAGFWHGLDIADQRDLGLIDDARASAARAGRARMRTGLARAIGCDPADDAAALRALLAHLAAGSATILLVTLEDLWGETARQNVPGTCHERPNWRHRARFDIRQALTDPAVAGLLNDIATLRPE